MLVGWRTTLGDDCPGNRIVGGMWKSRTDFFGRLRFNTGDKSLLPHFVLSTQNFDNQCCRFSFSVNNFRKPAPRRPVKIHFSTHISGSGSIFGRREKSLKQSRSTLTPVLIGNEVAECIEDVVVCVQC